MSGTHRGLRVGRRFAVLGAGALLAGAPPAFAAHDPLVPVPTKCNAYAPVAPCFYKPGFIDFTLNGHIFHRGDIVVGTLHYELPGQGHGEYATSASTSVQVGDGTLKFLGCKGKRSVTNIYVDKPTVGKTVCRWRARGGTGGWKLDLGAPLSITGSQVYVSGDYYTVIGQPAIEGYVRTTNDRKLNPVNTGVPGTTVQITGEHFKRIVPVTNEGNYFTRVPHPGTYTVYPRVPKRFTKTRKAIPTHRQVVVRNHKTARANFRVDDPLTLDIQVDRSSVPGDGFQVVHATITATEAGAPLPGLQIDVRPFPGQNIDKALNVPVPAVICTPAGSRVWPIGDWDSTPILPNTVTTDSNGQVKLYVQTGTIPGTFPLQVWARDSKGLLITDDLDSVSPTANITVTALGGSGDFPSALQTYLANHSSVQLDPYFRPLVLAPQLAEAAAAGMGSFQVIPIESASGPSGVLVQPAGTRVSFSPKGELPDTAAGGVLIPGKLMSVPLTYPTFTAAARAQGLVNLGALPTIPAFLTNKAPGWNFAGVSGPVRVQGDGRLHYYGYGYPTTGGCG